jgi:hypothetical protein
MDDTTLFGGFARTGGAGRRGRAVAAGSSAKVRGQRQLLIKLLQRWQRRGTVQPERYGGWRRAILAAHAARVHALLRAEPDLTIAELRSRLAAEAI